jgi:hypothetical protein
MMRVLFELALAWIGGFCLACLLIRHGFFVP